MATEILKSFGSLQSELEEAKNTLKGVDENIKRLIGRDPSELAPRPVVKRGLLIEDVRNRQRLNQGGRIRTFNHENDEPPAKRRNSSVFKRLSDRLPNYEEEQGQPQRQMISKIIVTPKEVPSRQEALAAQSSDEKFRARNKRMFGALLGTLQKFQQEETKLKPREQKRAQLEKKIEEHEIREKAEIKKERQELFLNRKKKQAEIKMIELKMLRMKEYATWEEKQKPRACFLTTKSKPHIHYLPRKLNDTNKVALEENKKEIEKMIEKRRQSVFDELKNIEERMKRNFKVKEEKEDENFENICDNVIESNSHPEVKDNGEESQQMDQAVVKDSNEVKEEPGNTQSSNPNETTVQVDEDSMKNIENDSTQIDEKEKETTTENGDTTQRKSEEVVQDEV